MAGAQPLQQIRFCSSPDGVSIAYATTGNGYPLVRAAHYLSHLAFDLESPVWQPWIRELSRHNEYVRYDERGVGLSDWNVPHFSFDAWVQDLETVVEALGLKRFALLGVSQGGPVGVAYAVRHPERVSHLILYGTYALGWAKRHQNPQDIEIREAMHQLMKLGWGRDEPTFRQVFTTQFIPGATAEQMRWFNELQKVTCSTENALKFDETFGQIDVRDLLARVSVPTLVLHAKADRVVPFEQGRQLAAMIPGAKFIPLESENHVLLENEPAWTQFLDAISTFVGNLGGAPVIASEPLVGELAEEELRHARDVIARSSRLAASEYGVVGNYVRYDPRTRSLLKEFRQKVVAGLKVPTQGRESYLLWGQPGSGKTYLVRQIADSLGPEVGFTELNLARLEEHGLRSALTKVLGTTRPCLCLVDEVDARATEAWPYEVLLPFLDPPADQATRTTFVLAGSSASSLAEMQQRMLARPKGPDILSRIPSAHEFSIPALSIEDRIAVVVAQLSAAAREHRRTVHEMERLALYYVVSNGKTSSPRQLRELAVRCVERLPEGEDRIKYDHLFDPGDAENKEFWLRTRASHSGLVDTFVSIG
ncbi:MAG: alpha/beta fold hydrolase [Thermoplasmata archaeon]|nr:alpha/beta fold hydrolase [Thermoplasmata archaeon]